jgi:hypothetical protein
LGLGPSSSGSVAFSVALTPRTGLGSVPVADMASGRSPVGFSEGSLSAAASMSTARSRV